MSLGSAEAEEDEAYPGDDNWQESMRPSKGGWPYNERSTRNCVHCRVCLTPRRWRPGETEERVYCGVGKKLGKYRNPLLRRVLKTATWITPVCRDCIMFDHDVPDVEPIV